MLLMSTHNMFVSGEIKNMSAHFEKKTKHTHQKIHKNPQQKQNLI